MSIALNRSKLNLAYLTLRDMRKNPGDYVRLVSPVREIDASADLGAEAERCHGDNHIRFRAALFRDILLTWSGVD